LTGKIVLEQVLRFDLGSAETVSAMYEALKQLMMKLKIAGYTNPLMLQFDALDPVTNEVVSIITNVFIKQINAARGDKSTFPEDY
jgi:hypothetical protein